MALCGTALVVAMLVFETDAVFLFARAIVEGVEQVVIDEKGEGTEDCAPVDGRQQTFEVAVGRTSWFCRCWAISSFIYIIIIYSSFANAKADDSKGF